MNNLTKIFIILFVANGAGIAIASGSSQCETIVKNAGSAERLFESVMDCELGLGQGEFAAVGGDELVLNTNPNLGQPFLPGGDITLNTFSNDLTNLAVISAGIGSGGGATGTITIGPVVPTVPVEIDPNTRVNDSIP